MTRQELLQLTAVLQSAYSNFKFDASNEMQYEVWYGALKDIDSKYIKVLVNKIISTEEYPPTIAAIRKHYAEIINPKRVTDTEGFGLVQEAIRKYGYMRAEEAMQSLPVQVQKAVKACGGYMEMCMSEEPDVMRGQFNKAMANYTERDKATVRLSLDLQTTIAQIQTMQQEQQLLEYNGVHKEIETTPVGKREHDTSTLNAMQSVMEIVNNLRGGKA